MTEVVWVPCWDIVQPPCSGTYEVYVDCWWVEDGNGNVAMWQKWPDRWAMANRDRTITERIGLPAAVKMKATAAVIQIPLGFIRHKCEDY